MKKFLILTLLILTSTFATVKAEETQIYYDFDSVNGYGYNLTSGKYEEKGYWSSTNKMLINPETTDSELLFTLLNFHHVLFWNDNNQYIGYINTSSATIELDTFLGYSATATTVIPENAKMFTLQGYDYGGIEDDIIYTNESIDDEVWSDLTYRDIFGDSLYGTGKTNLIDNGDFDSDITGWIGGNNNIIFDNGSIKGTGLTGTYQYIRQNVNTTVDYIYYFTFDFKADDIYTHFEYPSSAEGYTSNTNYYDTWHTEIDYYESVGYTFNQVMTRYYGTYNSLDSVVYLDNIMLFDLTSTFATYDMPTSTEFETMLDFYIAHVGRPQYITYDDLFSNQLISNNFFNDNIDNWDCEDWGYVSCNWDSNGYIHAYGDSVGVIPTLGVTQDITVSVGNIIYYNYDIYIDTLNVDANSRLSFQYGASYNVLNYFDNYEWTNLNGVTTPLLYDNDYIRFYTYSSDNYISGDYFYLDNVKFFDLTETFGDGLELDSDDFETLIEYIEWPTNSYYTADYHTSHLDLVGISYFYDQVMHDYDAETGINTYLTNLNINDDISKVILGIAIMIIIAIGLGLITRNTPIVIVVEIIAYLTFTILAWFPMWIVILLAIILALIGILKITSKGGNSND